MRVLTPSRQLLKLDANDWKILSEIKDNARQPLTKIAKKVHLSRSAVEYRLKQMHQEQLITGYRTLINIHKLGYKSYHVFLDAHTPHEEKELLARAIDADYVNALILYSGRYNLEISILAKDELDFLEKYAQLVDKIHFRKDLYLILLETISARVLPDKYIQKSSSKEKSFLTFRKKNDSSKFDSVDIKLLYSLSKEATKTNLSLAKELKISKDVLKYRLKKLEENGTIIEYRPAINYSALGLSINAVLINLSQDTEKIKQFENFLKNEPSVLWSARTFGYYDYLLYVISQGLDEFHQTINNLKKQFAELIKNYEVLFAYEEVKYEFISKNMVEELNLKLK